MEVKQEVIVHGVKASKGTLDDGKTYDSTVFHIEADLKGGANGGAIGKVTTPYKFGDSSEFDKWKHLAHSLPVKAVGVFEIQATGKGVSSLVLVDLKPMAAGKAAQS